MGALPKRRAHRMNGRNGVARDTDGRFSGPRVNVESVPRLPISPPRWTLEDPRGRAYFVFWVSESEAASLAYAIRMQGGRGQLVADRGRCGPLGIHERAAEHRLFEKR